MEWYGDVFRVLSLVVAWAIPAALVLAVLLFSIFAPSLALAGIGFRLYRFVFGRLGSKTQPEMQDDNTVCFMDGDCPPGFVCVSGHCVPAQVRALRPH